MADECAPVVVGGQALIVSFGGAAFQVVKISGRDWLISIILGALAMPLAILIRLLPTAPCERFMIRMRLYPDPNAPLPTMNPAAEEKQWNEGLSLSLALVGTDTDGSFLDRHHQGRRQPQPLRPDPRWSSSQFEHRSQVQDQADGGARHPPQRPQFVARNLLLPIVD